MGDKGGDEKYRYKKKGPVKAYPIKQLLETSQLGNLCEKPSVQPLLYSRTSTSPAPILRTKSNESFSSKNSPNSSRGVSPVQSYLQSQWPRDIRQSLMSNRNDMECQTESLDLKNEENLNCENCVSQPSLKSLTDSGVALNELKRIRRRASPNPQFQQTHSDNSIGPVSLFATGDSAKLASTNAHGTLPWNCSQNNSTRKIRPPSTENCELALLNDITDDYSRYVLTPLDGRRPPRPMSVDSQTQTDHICEKPVEFSKFRSPCQSPGRSIRQHPPSPGTNKSYLFKREPPDGAEVIKPICDSNKPSMIDSVQKPSFVRPENTFKPSPNSNFVHYKPQKNKSTNNRS